MRRKTRSLIGLEHIVGKAELLSDLEIRIKDSGGICILVVFNICEGKIILRHGTVSRIRVIKTLTVSSIHRPAVPHCLEVKMSIVHVITSGQYRRSQRNRDSVIIPE